MSFHPNDVARRGRFASVFLLITFAGLVSAFFNTQVRRHGEYVMQSEENRLRELPIPAARGIVYDRHGRVIAENLPGYSVSVVSPSADSLRAALVRLSGTIELNAKQIEAAVRRYRRAPNRPTVVLADAPFDVVSVLEERRSEFPGLVIQSAPKRYYPDGQAVASFIGYTGEITESELASPDYKEYKSGQQIGKGGLEKQYEKELRGREGVRFVEVDARGRVVSEAGLARQDQMPVGAPPLRTSIDMELQRYVAEIFGDSLIGGAIAVDPRSGEVLALHSAPTYDPNRFIGGIPASYWDSLNTDTRRPLYNKVIQGRYPPASTWKLATSIIALQEKLVRPEERMPVPCSGGYQFGSRYFRCWDKRGHGNVNLTRAIEVSCDVYFYQLGLRMGLSRLIAGGVDLDFGQRSGIDLPEEARPRFPEKDYRTYYNKMYGARGWTNAVTLNLSIGQGENAQTVANMARFYTALATDGTAAKPEIVKRAPQREQLFKLSAADMDVLRAAMAGVVSQGTARASAIQGLVLAGKTGTAQNSHGADHAWFVGFAPADDPQIVVSVMLEFGEHGSRAARIASAIVSRYLKREPAQVLQTEGE